MTTPHAGWRGLELIDATAGLVQLVVTLDLPAHPVEVADALWAVCVARQGGQVEVIAVGPGHAHQVDDDGLFREAFTRTAAVLREFRLVAAVATLAQARRALREQAPVDLLVLDVYLGDDNGLELIAWARNAQAGLAVAVLSGGDVAALAPTAIAAGARTARQLSVSGDCQAIIRAFRFDGPIGPFWPVLDRPSLWLAAVRCHGRVTVFLDKEDFVIVNFEPYAYRWRMR